MGRARSRKFRIMALMAIGEGSDQPECEVSQTAKGSAEIVARFAGAGQAKVTVDLSADGAPSQPTIEIRYDPQEGETEYLSIP